MEPIIEVKNLSKKYGKLLVLENINFDIYRGEILCIVGGSGCGKSTLLRQIIGLESPTTGEIYVDGELYFPSNAKVQERIMKKFGVMFQLGGLLASMTLEENIELPLKTYTSLSSNEIKEIIKIKLAAVGLDGFQDYLPSEISGGMKKRAALARAMALDPEILFFDEPSSGLDPITSAALDNLIIELNKSLGTTMIIVTHDLASIYNVAHRIVMLDKSIKGVLAIGTPEEMKNSSNELIYNFFNRKFN
jgi:ABC-type transport system involved in resistance to organic solvents, ATPase component